MRLVIISKALVVGAYQRKLEELARHQDLDLTCIVPPSWRQDGRDFTLERAHLAGYRLLIAPIRWNGNFHLFHFPGLRRQLARLRPDLVHMDEEPYNLATFLAARAARGCSARFVFFTWQNLQRRYPPPFSWFERYVYRRSSYALAGNLEAKQVLCEKGYRGPTAVIPQFGIDPDRFRPSPSPPGGEPNDCLRIVFLGRLVPEKGLWVLLDAVRMLRGSWRLDLFGHGPLREPLLARAAALGLSERVRVHPPVPSVDVPAQLQKFDVLVLPSLTQRNWKEQFGRALVEAMACGLAVIGSSSGEIPHVIGDAGIVVPEGSAAALGAGLAELQASARRRAELGARGRDRVLERFTHRQIASETAEVYRRALSGRRRDADS
jgi:glycosyltransferase involved in cell wall biosynthesis